jgi:hypothetical protein
MAKLRKYSLLLLDEAVRCAIDMGPKKASALTGVHKESIKKHRFKLFGKQNGVQKGAPLKYSICQKLECVKRAKKLVSSGMAKTEIAAFMAVGKQIGVDGRSIQRQWSRGYIHGLDEALEFAQQPATSRATSGASIQAAKSQDHLCAEQLKVLLLTCPEPKMIKRRKYTSDMLPLWMRKGHSAHVANL